MILEDDGHVLNFGWSAVPEITVRQKTENYPSYFWTNSCDFHSVRRQKWDVLTVIQLPGSNISILGNGKCFVNLIKEGRMACEARTLDVWMETKTKSLPKAGVCVFIC